MQAEGVGIIFIIFLLLFLLLFLCGALSLRHVVSQTQHTGSVLLGKDWIPGNLVSFYANFILFPWGFHETWPSSEGKSVPPPLLDGSCVRKKRDSPTSIRFPLNGGEL